MDPWVWAILLLVLGTGLAVLEIFFPSAGILAFLSVAAVLAAIVMGFNQGPVAGILILLAATGRSADRDRAGLQVLAEDGHGATGLADGPHQRGCPARRSRKRTFERSRWPPGQGEE